MAKAYITVASCNTPQGHFDTIHLDQDERVHFLVRLLNDEKVDVITMQEYGPAFDDAWKRHPNWAVVKGSNNNRPGQKIAGNAIAYRKDKLRVLDKRELTFKLSGRDIHMPVVLFEDRVTRVAFIVIGIHVPTRRDASAAKRLAINTRIIAYALKGEVRGFPVIIGGDRNDGHWFPWTSPPFKRGAQHQVDWILGSKRVEFTGDKDIFRVHGKVTDHPAMITVKAMLRGGNTWSDDLH